MSRQRPFEVTASAATVRQLPLLDGGCRLGCYTRRYTRQESEPRCNRNLELMFDLILKPS